MTKKYKFYTILICLLISVSTYSQNISFGEKKLSDQIKKAETYQDTLPGIYLNYINFIIQFSEVQNYPGSMCNAYKSLGDYYYYKGDVKKSTEFQKLALEVAKNANLIAQQADINIYLGINYDESGLLQLAVNHYQKASQLYEDTGNEIGYGMAQHNLGIIYQVQMQYDKAIVNYMQSLKIEKKHKNFEGIAYSLFDIAILYGIQEEVDSMAKYNLLFEKNIALVDNEYLSILNKYLIANFFNISGNHEECLKIKLEILEYYKSVESTKIIPISVDVAETLLALERNEEALVYLEKALENCDSIDGFYSYKRIITNLKDVHYKLHNIEKTFFYSNLYIDLMSNKYQKENHQLLTESEIRYETEKKEKDIVLLTKNNQIQKLKMNRFKYVMLFGLFVLVLVGVILFLTYKQSIFRKQTNETLNSTNEELAIANATKDKFFTIISHDVKNPLSAFTSVTSMLTQNFEHLSKEDLKEYLDEIHKSSSSLKDLMINLLHWARSQTNSIKPELTTFYINSPIRENINQLKSNITAKNIEIICNIESDKEIQSDFNIVKTITLNIISNAIKFTPENGKINISIREKDSLFELSICDNGIGMNEVDIEKLFRIDINSRTIGNSPEKGTGLGLILCKDLIIKLKGNITVDSQIGKGSCFKIWLPK